MEARFTQQDQPDGVPPLELTGERTLPDVPEENYWYRRHLVVYRWIADRVGGLDVTDLACGEGYGSATLAECAADVIGIDANPEAHAHAAARYRRSNLHFERDLVENVEGPRDAIVFLQTIEHVQDPGALLHRFAANLRATATGGDGALYVSTPNLLTLAPPGAEKSGNPWHEREYRAEEFADLCAGSFASVELLGLFHARKLRLHEAALRVGWDAAHARLGITEKFYGWFTPAITASDFVLRRGTPASLEGALDFLAVCRP